MLNKLKLVLCSELNDCCSGTEVGFHYIDQDEFKLSEATPVNAKKGDVVIFSYLLVHGSYVNTFGTLSNIV
jgi:ectoine hydroxylase-related dioxygenase (phytanoyl-CoA dioxygenase family)